jgi:hypothetical protein
MKTRTYKVKNPPIEFVRWLNKEYQNDSECHFTFKDFYWYKGEDKYRNRVYGCFVMNNNKLWSNPQGYANEFIKDINYENN